MDIGGLFGGISSMIGSIYSADRNFESVNNTNAQNYRIWREQRADEENRFNESLRENRYLTDLAYKRTIEQRDYENEYNSPAKQVERYRAAGLNPYLMMSGQNALGSVSAGSAPVGSPPSGYHAPSAPQMVSPQIPDMGAAFASAANTGVGVMKQMFDMSYMKREQDIKLMDVLSQMKARGVSNSKIDAETKRILQDYEWNAKTWYARETVLQKQIDKADSEIAYQKAMTDYQKLVNDFKPKEQDALLKNYAASYDKILSDIRNNDADSALKSAEKMLADARKEGVEIDNVREDAIIQYAVDKAEQQAEQERWKASANERDYREGEIGKRLGTKGDFYGNKHRHYVIRRDGKRVIVRK